jgi:hypothetical protein
MRFGHGNVSDKTRKALEQGGAHALEPIKYIHAIYPREERHREQGKIDDVNMPIASCYFELDNKHICRESGFPELPVFVSRYLEWGSGAGQFYGWSPSFTALPEARQVNFGAKMLDAAAEKEAFPPLLAPDELEGEIDSNANAVTYFSRDLAQTLPRRLNDGPVRLDWMVERVQERQKAIKEAFHVDLFSMFAQLEKQMTAREVAERASEKLIQFSPTFARMTTEVFNPLLHRVFNIGCRNDWYTMPPESLLRPVGPGQMFIEPPKVQYASRIALALRSLPTMAYHRTLERLMTMAAIVPSVLDNYDFDEAERQTAMNDGVPPEFIRTEDDTEAIRAERAAQQQQAQQMAQAASVADAAAKVGGIPADSPVGQAMGAMMPKAA